MRIKSILNQATSGRFNVFSNSIIIKIITASVFKYVILNYKIPKLKSTMKNKKLISLLILPTIEQQSGRRNQISSPTASHSKLYAPPINEANEPDNFIT